jgi:hypothetical protein
MEQQLSLAKNMARAIQQDLAFEISARLEVIQ